MYNLLRNGKLMLNPNIKLIVSDGHKGRVQGSDHRMQWELQLYGLLRQLSNDPP